MKDKLGIHETLELHELLTFKTTCAVKSSTAILLANDHGLKSMLEDDLKRKKQHIKDLQGLLQGGL